MAGVTIRQNLKGFHLEPLISRKLAICGGRRNMQENAFKNNKAGRVKFAVKDYRHGGKKLLGNA